MQSILAAVVAVALPTAFILFPVFEVRRAGPALLVQSNATVAGGTSFLLSRIQFQRFAHRYQFPTPSDFYLALGVLVHVLFPPHCFGSQFSMLFSWSNQLDSHFPDKNPLHSANSSAINNRPRASVWLAGRFMKLSSLVRHLVL